MAQLSAVLAELEELLALLDRWEESNLQLWDRLHQWRGAAHAACTAAGGPGASPAGEAARLSRCLQKACEVAATAEQHVASRLPQGADNTSMILSNITCLLLEGCLRLVSTFEAGPSAPPLVSQAAACIVVGSGRQLLEQLGCSLSGQAGGADIPPAEATNCAFIVLSSQTCMLVCWLHALREVGQPVSRDAPAAAFGSWVLAASRLLKLLGVQNRSADYYKRTLRDLATVVYAAQQPGLGHLARSLQQPQLGALWFDLLTPAIAAAAVGFSLPAERRPLMCDWHFISICATALSSPMLQPTLDQHAEVARQDGSSPEAASLSRVLTSAAALVQLRQAAGDSEYMSSLMQLLGQATVCQLQATRGPAGARRRQRHTQQLHGLFPILAQALQQRVSGGRAVDVAICVSALHAVLLFLGDAAQQPGAIRSLSDIEVWAAAATTALRMLPAAAEAARQLAAQRAAVQQDGLPAITSLADSAAKFALVVGEACSQAAGEPAAWLQPASPVAAPAVSAVWQLHSAACRLAIAHSSLCQHLPCIGRLDRLVALAAAPAIAAAVLVRLARSAAVRDGGTMPSHVRDMEALALAHIEGMHALFSGGAPDALRRSDGGAMLAVQSLAQAVECSPAALASRPDVQELFNSSLRCLPQEPVLAWTVLRALLGAATARSPHLGALLLSNEALDAFQMQALLQTSSDSIEATLGILPPLLEKLKLAAEQAIAAAEGAGGGGANDADLVAALRAHSGAVGRALCTAPTVRELSQDRGQLATAVAAGTQLAAALLAWWRRPEAQRAAAVELAQAAARRSCAYLRCANLGGQGGPAAGEGKGSMRCSACRAVWYCGTACSHADWRAGHRRVCKMLGEARAAEKEGRQQAAAAAAAGRAGDDS